MKYKATKKFKTLSRANAHQGLDKEVFDRLLDGKAVECKPPESLIKDGYLIAAIRNVVVEETSHGN